MPAPLFETDRKGIIFFGPSLRYEADIYDCEVEGLIPDALRGNFFRVGPSRQYPSRYPEDAPINGDGMVSMFRIANGHVQFKCRWVQTPRLIAEQKARRALFGLYRNRYTNDASVADLPLHTMNTHIVYHGGKLLALKEDSPPFAIDPDTLATEGPWDFRGAMRSLTFTAHPKIDRKTGEMFGFGYEAKGDATRDIAVYGIDRTGKITWEMWIDAPYVSFMHDMIVTESHIIIPTTKYTTSVERLKAGQPRWAWDESLPVRLAVIPRGGAADDVRWVAAPQRCSGHTVNGFDAEGRIHMDHIVTSGPAYDDMFPSIDGSPLSRGSVAFESWSVDSAVTEATAQSMTLSTEFTDGLARIDDRFIGRPYSIVFGSMPYPGRPIPGIPPMFANNAVVRCDRATGEMVHGFAGPTHTMAEVVFAPRAEDAPEGDGWVMGVAMNHATARSELVIFDTAKLTDGPVARVLLPFVAPPQIHGTWTPDWDLPISR